jgi:predicted nucleic-acid-binding Zn-ribbon protein
MKDITDFSELLVAVRKITNSNNIAKIDFQELEDFEGQGLDTDLTDVFATNSGELFTILSDGTIRKAIAHICDISNYKEHYKLPKFHIFDCTRMQEMRESNRSKRYRKASRKDGTFWIIERDKQGYWKRLDICSCCKNEYNQVYQDNVSVNNFNLQNYLKQPMRHQQPYVDMKIDMTTIPQAYVNQWSKISRKRKEFCNWECQQCGYDCKERLLRQFLHTHHIDADLSNNRPENLKVLCIECHAEEYQHQHIKKTPKYKEFIRQRRGYAG